MKKVVKKLLGYLMILVLVVGMFSGVPAKAATLSEDSKSVSFNYQGVDTVIDQYLTKDGKTMWLIVDNELYSYDIASGVFTSEHTFGFPESIGEDKAISTIEEKVDVFINDNTGMLVYAYNRYYDADTADQLTRMELYDLEKGEYINTSQQDLVGYLDSVFCDDNGLIYYFHRDSQSAKKYSTYSISAFLDEYFLKEENQYVCDGYRVLDCYDISEDGKTILLDTYSNSEHNYLIATYSITSDGIVFDDGKIMYSFGQSYNESVGLIDDTYLAFYPNLRLYSMPENELVFSLGNYMLDKNLYYGTTMVLEDDVVYVLYDQNTVYGCDITNKKKLYRYVTEDNIFNMQELSDGVLLLMTNGEVNDAGECEYYYKKMLYDDMEPLVKTVNINEVEGTTDKTKEKITRKFVDAIQSPDANIYAQEGSSVAPYKAYVLTEDAKKSSVNLINYYRYLAGLEEVSVGPEVIWEYLSHGVVLSDVHSTYFVDGEVGPGPSLQQPSDMDDDFYEMAEIGWNNILDINIGATKTVELLNGFRGYLNSKDDEGYENYLSEWLLSTSATEGAVAVSKESFGIATTHDYTYSDDSAVAWPSAGYFPVEELEEDSYWHLMPDYLTYEFNNNDYSVEITDMSTGETSSAKVVLRGDGIITFESPDVDSYKDKTYKIVVTGFFNSTTGEEVIFEYTVSFFSYKDVKLTIDGKEYTCDEYGNLTATETPFVAPDIDVSYRTHIQTFGWEGTANDITTWKENGEMSGTSGLAKRLEGINVVVNPTTACEDLDLGIQYTTHCQTYGWLPWSADGDMNGTEGEAKRLEAIKIQLTGEHAELYDVYYRVHAQTYGWLAWTYNGAPAGTAGFGKRLEGIQIVVVKKGESFDQNMGGITSMSGLPFVAKEGSSPIVNYPATSNTNPIVPGEDDVNVAYRTHVQSYGWQAWKYNGQMSGTSGEAKRLEGINIQLRNKDCDGGIVYTTHVQTYGWQGQPDDASRTGWKKNGEMSGTSGEAKRLEAICIDLTGEMAENYDIYYRVHAQTYGWLGWAKNGAPAGTAGYAKRLEGIQIVLVPKGGAAPGDYQGIKSADSRAYVEK